MKIEDMSNYHIIEYLRKDRILAVVIFTKDEIEDLIEKDISDEIFQLIREDIEDLLDNVDGIEMLDSIQDLKKGIFMKE